MDWLEQHLAIFPAPEMILVVGAGQGRDLPVLASLSHTRLIMLEPQRQWAEFLRRQTQNLPQAEVLEYALDERSGTATFTVFNFPELSSLRPDPDVSSIFPGARQTTKLSVETRSLSDLARHLQLPASPNNWLIVDAPGIESAVLTSLEDHETRRLFGHLVLRTSHRSLDGEDDESEWLGEALLTRGYRALGGEDRSDGDWPRLHLQHFGRSPLHKELEVKHDSLVRHTQNLTAEKSGLQQRLEQQRAKLDGTISKQKDQLRSLNRSAEQRLAAITKELEQSKKALEKQKKQATKVAELRGQLAEANKTLESRQAELDQRGEEARELEKKQEAQVAERIESVRQETNDHIERLERAIEQAKSDLSVSLRMQTLREHDLKELQKRYADVLETRNAQHELLLKIRKRLSLAAEYLLQLKNENDEERKSELTSGLVEALAHNIGEGE
ncbi:MAG: FkbM family methyltransferase [Pseudomonadota bacterium]